MPAFCRIAVWLAAAALLVPGRSHAVEAIRSRFPPHRGVILAVASLSAPAAGTDAAPTIQRVVDRVAAGGGGTVFLREGRYRLDTPITLKEGVVLRGEKPEVGRGAKGQWIGFAGQGTLLMPTAGRGSAEGTPAITVERGTGVTDLSIWYPEQKAGDIQPYPWTIAGSAAVSGDNYTVRNVLFVNAYQAMRFGPEWNELHTVRDVCGTALKTGVYVDTCTDIGRLTDVEFSPRYWETAALPGAPAAGAVRAAFRRALLGDTVGVDMGRSDWEYQFRVRVEGMGIGFRYRPGSQGSTNGVMWGCAAVGCRVGLEVVEMNGVGLAASACRFEGGEAGVATGPRYTAVTQLNGCTVASSRGPAVRASGRGVVTICRSRLTGAGPVIDALGGTVVALGCRLAGAAPQVRLAAGVRTARVLDCRTGGRPSGVATGGVADCVVDARPLALDEPAPAPAITSVTPAPVSRRVVDAAAYGATPAVADCTRAIQAALEAAGTRGGTVYLPAGRYRVAGALVVPAGVELRGSFDVPHHTQSGGSVLLATGGRGEERGAPLLRLRQGSGVRGITVWYPEQSLVAPVPYPWTVQSTGPGCWMTDVTIGNGWQGADFWTHPSTGHSISYMAGGFFRRGLFVSKSSSGVVEDVQYNPHYMARIQADLPRPTYAGDPFGQVIAYQQANLEGLVFGSCRSEQILRTFLYSAIDGLKFVDDRGGTSGIVINHGTDAGSRSVTFGAVSSGGIDLHNTQLVVLGSSQVAAVVTLPGFRGQARLFNTQIWAPGALTKLEGPGRIVMQQFNNVTGPATADAGSLRLDGGYFQGNWQPAVMLGARTRGSSVIGCLQPKGLTIGGAAGRARALGNSAPPRSRPGPTTFASAFGPAEPQPVRDTVQAAGGGERAIGGMQCRLVEGAGPGGAPAVRLAGNADDPAHSFVYARLFGTFVVVHADTVLSYWMRPANPLSRKAGLDLLFDDGSTLRDSGGSDTLHRGVHPGTDRGVVGEWQQVVVPLGHKAGDAITTIMAAFDGRPGGGPFETLFAGIRIGRSAAR